MLISCVQGASVNVFLCIKIGFVSHFILLDIISCIFGHMQIRVQCFPLCVHCKWTSIIVRTVTNPADVTVHKNIDTIICYLYVHHVVFFALHLILVFIVLQCLHKLFRL